MEKKINGNTSNHGNHINSANLVCFILGNSPASEFCMAYKIQTPGNYPEENVQHSQHGESLKSRMLILVTLVTKAVVYARQSSYTVASVISTKSEISEQV
jgi:hypothetical protein